MNIDKNKYVTKNDLKHFKDSLLNELKTLVNVSADVCIKENNVISISDKIEGDE